MVKNTVGGGKSKKIARKLTTSFISKEPTRFSSNELEQYALVTKIYGNGRCQVKTHGDLDIQCVIRNKFKGRSKRGNIIAIGTYILIGLREWETSSGYKTCDLLEIYDKEDVTILQNQKLFKNLITKTSEKDTNDGLFSLIDTENTHIEISSFTTATATTATATATATTTIIEEIDDDLFDDI
jgi:hypothetical protein